jgi:hypothetical protein
VHAQGDEKVSVNFVKQFFIRINVSDPLQGPAMIREKQLVARVIFWNVLCQIKNI